MVNNIYLNTLNVRGLGNNKKCSAMLNWLGKTPGIYFLQETHSNDISMVKWKKHWKGAIYFSHGTTNSRGVAILIHSNITHQVLEEHTDESGRYIILKVKINDQVVVLTNCYLPTKDHEKEQIAVLESITSALSNFSECSLIVGGDFNVTLNPSLEKSNYDSNVSESKTFRASVKGFLITFHLEDLIRNFKP